LKKKKNKGPVPADKKVSKKSDSPVGKRQADPSPKASALVKFDPLQRYLQELSQYELLTKEEEKELAIRVQEEGDREAAYRLVTSNLRLVVKIAIDFQRMWMQNLLDLIQEGNIGLMQAVQKFDPHRGVKFSYYASFWIKAYILKFIMDNWRLVKIGTTQAQRKLFFRLKKEKQRLASEGYDPKPKLLSERLGVSEQEVTDMDQRLDRWEVSLDAPIKEGSDNERIEFISTQAPSAETQVAKKEMKAIVHEKLDSFRKELSEREIYILENRVFSDTPATLQEIGERYGITRERVRQIESSMIKKIRAHFEREIPDFETFIGQLGTDG
jgi:RNA polymerase sigma-32 factor